jgi:hypothetical protein
MATCPAEGLASDSPRLAEAADELVGLGICSPEEPEV